MFSIADCTIQDKRTCLINDRVSSLLFMMTTYSGDKRIKGIFQFIKTALVGKHQDFTTGSIRKAIFLLAIPMILEMCMESVFAVVDIFFVSHLGKYATSVVGLTESVITIIYSLAIGISMAASTPKTMVKITLPATCSAKPPKAKPHILR